VAGVQAQADRRGVEQPVDVTRRLDGHPPVRVQGRLEPGVADDPIEPVQVGQEGRPFVLGHVDRGVVASVMGRRPEDEDLRAGRGELARGPRHVLELPVDAVGPVEERRHEAADDAHVVPAEEVDQLGRLGGQIAIGTELGGTQPALDHLAHDAVAAHEVAPAWRPVDTPGDRRAGHPFQEIAHVLPTLLHAVRAANGRSQSMC
jgi:hypothetical protein